MVARTVFSDTRYLPLVLIASGIAIGAAFGLTNHAEGYEGVKPGAPKLPDHIKRIKKTDTPTVVWSGFQQRDAGSRFFLLSTSSLDYSEHPGQRQFELHFQNTKAKLSNTLRRIDTSHFSTPVKEAKIMRAKKTLIARYSLKEDASARVYTEPGPDGFSFLFIEFQ